MKVNTKKAISIINKYIEQCDGEELARLLGEILGAEVYQNRENSEYYDITPNDYFNNQLLDS